MTSLGRYRLDRVLGAGSFATVWKGYDPELDIWVAVKVLADNWSLDADVRQRFLTEARLLRRIVSDRVVRVHDVGLADERPYFVMDYVAGGTLADRVGTLEPAEALRLTIEAGRAVQVLHEAGVVHRDVKPANLLLDDSVDPARVLVGDLGSVKLLADATGLTLTTGTPAYMAPEQASGSVGFDARADVYALGVLGYELVAGRRPAEVGGVGPVAVAAPRGLPAEVDAVLAAALQPDRRGRPADAGAFADRLTAASAGARRRDGWPLPVVLGLAVLLFAFSAALAWVLR